MTDIHSKSLGFVGTGTITRAIVNGLLEDTTTDLRIIVSPRNSDVATELAAANPQVTIAANNQAVVDSAEIVFLAVRPQIAADVVPALKFRSDQLVISLIAATERSKLKDWVGEDVELAQAIPLPFVERREGATAIFPPNSRVAALFNRLGTAVECETRLQYDLLAAASATMSMYFGQMGRIVEWLSRQGLPEATARAYMSAHFESLSKEAARKQDIPLETLVREFATKGGLNEQVWTDFEQHGGTKAILEALNRVYSRITG